MLTLIEAIQHFGLVVLASLVGSLIFTGIFIRQLKRNILEKEKEKAQKWFEETKEKTLKSLEEAIKKGFSAAIADEEIKKVICDALELAEKRIKKKES